MKVNAYAQTIASLSAEKIKEINRMWLDGATLLQIWSCIGRDPVSFKKANASNLLRVIKLNNPDLSWDRPKNLRQHMFAKMQGEKHE